MQGIDFAVRLAEALATEDELAFRVDELGGEAENQGLTATDEQLRAAMIESRRGG